MTLEELRAQIVAEDSSPPEGEAMIPMSIALALIDVADAAEDVRADNAMHNALIALDAALAAQEKA